LHCTARGSPTPQIVWQNIRDGQTLKSYSGVRQVLPNGTIHFPPFRTSFYRPDVHHQIYVCIASNPVGTIRSRDIHVRAGNATSFVSVRLSVCHCMSDCLSYI